MPLASFTFLIPLGAVAAAVIAVAMVAVFLLARRAIGAHRQRRLLLALRAATLVTAFFLATQPSWSSERSERTPGRLAILVDASRSMGVGREQDRRSERARRLLARWATEPSARRASVYTFGSEIAPVEFADLARDSASGGFQPTGEESRIVDALRELVRDDERDEIGAVVVVSDGADTTTTTVDGLSLGGVRVHTVAVADEQRDRDDAIVAVRPDARAFLRTPYRIRATVRATALAGETVPVTLERGGRAIDVQRVSLDARGEGEVDFAVMPERIGRVFHRLVIPTDPADVVPENNTRSVLVRVGRERLRVLLVAGHPSWDVRYLRAFLERDPTNDLISFFILRTETDMMMADPSEMSLIPFPTDELFRQHLASFDLVVFQDFDFGPYRMAQYLPLIQRYVADGGSFAMIGGEKSFSAGGYVGTSIERMLPVTLPPGVGSSSVSVDRFRPALVPATELHPIVALAPTRDDNRALFGRLAENLGANVFTGLRAGAVPLLVHPELRSADGQPMPVLAVGEHDRGRVLALGVDTSFRWGIATAAESGDGSVFERFWERAVRWLARDPALEPAQVLTDRERYGLGASVRVQVLARRPSYEPMAGERVRLSLLDEAGVTLRTANVQIDAEGRAEATLEGPARPGVHRIAASLASEAGGGIPLAEEAFVVEASGDELADPRPAPALLQRLAQLTDGRFSEDTERAPRLADYDLTRERSLGLVTESPFRSPYFVALALGLFGLEWIVRRRLGLR